MELKKFIQSLKLPIKNFDLYEQAFIHKSFLNENEKMPKNSNDYECLEFLGDSILSSAISTFLFSKIQNLRQMVLYKHYLQGNSNLAKISRNLKLNLFIKVGKGMAQEEINNSLSADVFEAFIAAIFLNSDWMTTSNFIKKYLLIPCFNPRILELDFKTLLQEKAMKYFGVLPKYEILNEENIFIAHCKLNNQTTIATGQSKKNATKESARLMLLKLKWIDKKIFAKNN